MLTKSVTTFVASGSPVTRPNLPNGKRILVVVPDLETLQVEGVWNPDALRFVMSFVNLDTPMDRASTADVAILSHTMRADRYQSESYYDAWCAGLWSVMESRLVGLVVHHDDAGGDYFVPEHMERCINVRIFSTSIGSHADLDPTVNLLMGWFGYDVRSEVDLTTATLEEYLESGVLVNNHVDPTIAAIAVLRLEDDELVMRVHEVGK